MLASVKICVKEEEHLLGSAADLVWRKHSVSVALLAFPFPWKDDLYWVNILLDLDPYMSIWPL